MDGSKFIAFSFLAFIIAIVPIMKKASKDGKRIGMLVIASLLPTLLVFVWAVILAFGSCFGSSSCSPIVEWSAVWAPLLVLAVMSYVITKSIYSILGRSKKRLVHEYLVPLVITTVIALIIGTLMSYTTYTSITGLGI